MNNRKYFTKDTVKSVCLIGFVCFLLLNSCTYNREVENPEQYSVLYIPQAIETKFVTLYKNQESNRDIEVGAAFGGLTGQDRDIHVQFEIANELVETYNAQNNTDYEAFPVENVIEEGFDVIIPKGKTTSNLYRVGIKSSHELILGKQYLLPFRMKGIDVPLSINPKLETAYFVIEPRLEFLDRSNWEIADFSGDENEFAKGGRAINMIDNDPLTIWSTPWRLSQPVPPHHITINLGEVETLWGARLTMRRANNGSAVVYHQGVPKDVVIQGSLDGDTWFDLFVGTLSHQLVEDVYFDEPKESKFIKFIVNSTNDGFYQTHVAELEVF